MNRKARTALLLAASLGLTAGSVLASDGMNLAKQNNCMACHGVSNKIVGPAFTDIAAKYKGDAGAKAALMAKVHKGTSGTWGPIPMPPQAQVKEQDLETIVAWILGGAK